MPGNKTYGTLRCWTHEDEVADTEQLGRPAVEKEIDSYLGNWGKVLAARVGTQNAPGAVDVNGNTVEVNNSPGIQFSASSGVTDQGILIGAGSTTEAIDDYKLGNAFTSAFSYGNCNVSTGSIGSASVELDITRTATNTSGDEKTVSEVGVRSVIDTTGSGNVPMLCIRDVLTDAFDVPDGDNSTQEYTLEFEV